MPDAAVTLSSHTIHNPSEPRHFMRLKPVTGRVRALRGGEVLADASDATQMIEIGKDVYDPVFYFPETSLAARLRRNDRTTHCPLKGDAVYFDLLDGAGDVAQASIAWSYPDPFDFAPELTGLIAFYPQFVAFEETRG